MKLKTFVTLIALCTVFLFPIVANASESDKVNNNSNSSATASSASTNTVATNSTSAVFNSSSISSLANTSSNYSTSSESTSAVISERTDNSSAATPSAIPPATPSSVSTSPVSTSSETIADSSDNEVILGNPWVGFIAPFLCLDPILYGVELALDSKKSFTQQLKGIVTMPLEMNKDLGKNVGFLAGLALYRSNNRSIDDISAMYHDGADTDHPSLSKYPLIPAARSVGKFVGICCGFCKICPTAGVYALTKTVTEVHKRLKSFASAINSATTPSTTNSATTSSSTISATNSLVTENNRSVEHPENRLDHSNN